MANLAATDGEDDKIGRVSDAWAPPQKQQEHLSGDNQPEPQGQERPAPRAIRRTPLIFFFGVCGILVAALFVYLRSSPTFSQNFNLTTDSSTLLNTTPQQSSPLYPVQPTEKSTKMSNSEQT